MDRTDRLDYQVLVISAQKSLVKKLTKLIRTESPEFDLFVAESGVQGLNRVYQQPPALILVDSTLSDISGLQICRVLKRDPAIRKLPILLITKGNTEDYRRFSELSVIADCFIEEKQLEQEFPEQLRSLVRNFEGIEEGERQQLSLLQKDSIQVKALNRMVQLFDQSITEVAMMKGFQKLFERIPNKNILHHLLFGLIENVIDYDIAGVFFNDKNREPRLMTYHVPRNIQVQDAQLKVWADRIFSELKGQSSEPWVFNATRHELITPEFNESPEEVEITHQAIYPFYIESVLVGALVFFNRREVNYEMIFPFPLLLQEMSALMRIRYYYSEAEMLSICDALTGLYTHTHFMWCLEREIRQAKRHHMPVTLAMIRVEDFRELNLKWGYDSGDKIMQSLARHALQNVRSTDLLARAGGRKILALFPNTAPKGAINAIKRIRTAVENNPFAWEHETIPLHLSIGLVGLDDTIGSATDFIEQAQKAVELAREKGHDAVEIYNNSNSVPTGQ